MGSGSGIMKYAVERQPPQKLQEAVATRRRVLDKRTQELVLLRLAKIEGQIRGLARMVEEPRLCVEIITQIAAAQAALKSVGDLIMDYHLHGCLEEAFFGGKTNEKRKRMAELREIFSQYCKLPTL